MLSFTGVTKTFGNGTLGLSEISFKVEPGGMVMLTGPSGSGKTSIMKMLIKEYIPSAGEIEFNGVKLSTIKPKQLPYHRREIGVVFQDYKLIPELNVWENIALPLWISGKSQTEVESRVTDLLNLVDLISKALLFPIQLSGGEAQRVSIARALATGPKLIFADEPTGNLDKSNSLHIAKLLHKINKLGTTILFATHDQVVISALNDIRVITLEAGKLVKDTGGPTEITKPTQATKPDDLEDHDSKTTAPIQKSESTDSESQQPEFTEENIENLPEKPTKRAHKSSSKSPTSKKSLKKS